MPTNSPKNDQHPFATDHISYWANLARLNNLLVIVNISMFFLTGLVAQGYYFTCYSLVCLGVVGLAAVIPTRLARQVWYYWIFLVVELLALYFVVASVVYWMQNGSG